jgi:ribosomal RNA-processing protein 9
MSSFFTIPGAQKKRKRVSFQDLPKKRQATNKSPPKAAAKPTRARPAPRSNKRKQEEEPDSDAHNSVSDSDVDSDDEDATPDADAVSDADSSEHGDETAAQRRLRLAERYLDNVRQEVEDDGNDVGFDAEQIDRDLIAERLQEDVAEAKGKVFRQLSSQLDWRKATHCLFRWNTETVTSVATSAPFAYTVTKDMFLTKWRIQELPGKQWPRTSRKKQKKADAPPRKRPERLAWSKGDTRKVKDKNYLGHTASILAVAASQDGKFVVTGGLDRRIVVWDASTMKALRMWNHHRDAVTGLAFRRGTNQVYSSSKDRTIKVWDLDTGSYIQTLFGHQEGAEDISALAQERCLSVSGDRTARLWRVVEETQLVFRGGGTGSEKKRKDKDRRNGQTNSVNGIHTTTEEHDEDEDVDPYEGIDPYYLGHEGSMDRVSYISDDLFVTGSDNGSIALWTISRKKPLFVLPLAHGLDPALKAEQVSANANPDPKLIPPRQARWITALCAVPYSDLFLSGSWDGFVRVWKLSEDKRRIEAVGKLGAEQSPIPDLSNGRLENVPRSILKHEPALGRVRGVINEISVFERGERGKDGLGVLVATGKQHRLGKWLKLQAGRNGAMVFEVPRIARVEANGHLNTSEDEHGGD